MSNQSVNGKSPKLAIGIGLLFVTAFGLLATKTGKQSPEAEKAASAQRERIRAELRGLSQQKWAGEYYEGDGLGINITLIMAAEAGFMFEWHGCLGLYDRNYGSILETNGEVHLSFAYENVRKGFRGIAPAFVPVRWGSRHYLIPTDDITGFCNEINQGSEPRKISYGSYLLQLGDERLPVKGLPEIPAAYRGYLLSKPVEATIVSVGKFTLRPSVADWKFKDTPVTLDAGTNQGLLPGMELRVVNLTNGWRTARIIEAQADKSNALMVDDEEDEDPKVGWRLSTRWPWVK